MMIYLLFSPTKLTNDLRGVNLGMCLFFSLFQVLVRVCGSMLVYTALSTLKYLNNYVMASDETWFMFVLGGSWST